MWSRRFGISNYYKLSTLRLKGIHTEFTSNQIYLLNFNRLFNIKLEMNNIL